MKSSATITKVGWVGRSATQHQDFSNIFRNCYYGDLNKFQVHTKPKPAMCQANTSPLCCSQAKKRSYFSSCDRVASDFNRPLYGRYPSILLDKLFPTYSLSIAETIRRQGTNNDIFLPSVTQQNNFKCSK